MNQINPKFPCLHFILNSWLDMKIFHAETEAKRRLICLCLCCSYINAIYPWEIVDQCDLRVKIDCKGVLLS